MAKMKPSVRNKYLSYLKDKREELAKYEKLAAFAINKGIPYGPVLRKIQEIQREIADTEFHIEQAQGKKK